MSTIKDIQKLSSLLVADDMSKLDAGAALHGRHSNISFKVVKVDDKAVTIQTTQGKHLSENYASQKDLIDRTRELFGRFIQGKDIYVHAVAYVVPPTDVVTPQWIASQMNAKGVRIKDMVTLTGLDKTNLSAWINDKRDMSNIVKAMFYYFFASVGNHAVIDNSVMSELPGRIEANESGVKYKRKDVHLSTGGKHDDVTPLVRNN